MFTQIKDENARRIGEKARYHAGINQGMDLQWHH